MIKVGDLFGEYFAHEHNSDRGHAAVAASQPVVVLRVGGTAYLKVLEGVATSAKKIATPPEQLSMGVPALGDRTPSEREYSGP